VNYVGNYLKAGPSNAQKIAKFDYLNADRTPTRKLSPDATRPLHAIRAINSTSSPNPAQRCPHASSRQLGLPRPTFRTDNTPLLPANQADNYTWPQPHRNQHVVNQ